MLFLYQISYCKYPAVWGKRGIIRYKTTMKSYKTTRRKLSTGIKLSTNGSDQLFNASICLLDTRDILCWTKFSFY